MMLHASRIRNVALVIWSLRSIVCGPEKIFFDLALLAAQGSRWFPAINTDTETIPEWGLIAVLLSTCQR
jgi:hypothetical protein